MDPAAADAIKAELTADAKTLAESIATIVPQPIPGE